MRQDLHCKQLESRGRDKFDQVSVAASEAESESLLRNSDEMESLLQLIRFNSQTRRQPGGRNI